MKKEVRILGFDDGPFTISTKKVLVVGTVYRGGKFFDGVLSTKITKDGLDSTDKLIKLINKSKFKPQIQCVMLDGVALGGFNVVDIHRLSKEIKLPIITVMRNLPDMDKIESALSNLDKSKERLKLIKKAGTIHNIGDIFIQIAGTDIDEASKFIRISVTKANIPEPIRVAHIIASGIVAGESKGDA